LLSLVGQVIANEFNFFTVTTMVYSCLIVAYLLSLARIKTTELNLNFSLLLKIFLSLSVTIIFVLLAEINIDKLKADYYFALAKKWEIFNSYPKMIGAYQQVFKASYFEPYYRWQFAQSLLNYVSQIKDKNEQGQVLLLAYDNLLKINNLTRNFEAEIRLARVQTLFGYYVNSEEFTAAEKTYQQLAIMSPQLAKNYAEWGKMYLYWQRYDQAAEKLQWALGLYPSLADWRLNDEHRQLIQQEMSRIHQDLGQVYFYMKNYPLAIDYYLRAYQLDQRHDILKNLADTYYAAGQPQQTLQQYLHLVTMEPLIAGWYERAGMLYNELGKKSLADEYAKRAKELEEKFK
jgi:tetratricopeptide (TPR) repeat protein